MKTYRASYSINSQMFDGGAWMPDLETHHRDLEFTAKDDFEAIDIALERMKEVGENYFDPKITLDRIVQFQERELKCLADYLKARKQL